MGMYFLIIAILVSVISCHFIAKSRGLKPVFWGAMGLVFGPLAIIFVCLAKPKSPVSG